MTARLYLLLQGKYMAYMEFHKLSCMYQNQSEEIVHFMNTQHRDDNVVEMLTPTHHFNADVKVQK